MDPATIAASAAALLAPYLKKAAEDFVGEAGKYVQEKAKVLWQKLRSKLDGDPPAKEVLDRFEADPVAHGEAFQAKLEEKVAQDPPLSDELSSELAEIKRNAPYVRVVQKMREAEGVVGLEVKRLKRGTVVVTQEIDKAKNITGAKLDEIS
jgi:D-alanyl-D-alanine carboxypeptidase